MVGEQELRTSRHSLEREVFTALSKARGFSAEVGMRLALLRLGCSHLQKQQRNSDRQFSHIPS
jgi:hypothetical protein